MEVYVLIFALIVLSAVCFAFSIGRKVGRKEGRASMVLDVAQTWSKHENVGGDKARRERTLQNRKL